MVIWQKLTLLNFVFFGFFSSLDSNIAQAEPWISNRYAQNCSGCHAPGRKNLPPVKRRCSLSCQGCHVNPSGGGLRNFYGKWNENRWLRSFRFDFLKQKKAPAPLKRQRYGKKPYAKKEGKKKKKDIPPRVITTTNVDPDEKLFDRNNDGMDKQTALTDEAFYYQIPFEDPIRIKQRTKIDAGADVRWQILRGETERSSESGAGDGETKLWANFLMSTDVGVRWRPVHKRYHLVYEGRYLGSPTEKKTEAVANTLTKRSLYVLVDDLWYASYIQAGYYRPMFGNYDPDHTSLAQTMLSQAYQENSAMYNLNYQTYTIGASPNVPFVNVHLITKQGGVAANDTHKGVALNLGGRFVTMGASVNYSFWNTQKDNEIAGETVTTRLQMHSFGGAIQVARSTISLEAVSMAKDIPNDAFHKGLWATLDTHTQIWRQNYFKFSYAQANIAQNLKPGSANQLRFGVRSFLTAGVDTMLLFSIDRDEIDAGHGPEASDTKSEELIWQLHLYM